MSHILPQQRLLLELLVMSGDIAVTDMPDHSTLGRTLDECIHKHWVIRKTISPGYDKITVTPSGRAVSKIKPNSHAHLDQVPSSPKKFG